MGELASGAVITLDLDVYSPPAGVSEFVSIFVSETVTDFEEDKIIIELVEENPLI